MIPRRFILIDIENFNGGPVSTPSQAKWCRRMLDNWLTINRGDQVVIAADVHTVTNIHLAWPQARILAGRCEDGADLRLLTVMDENLAEKYTELVLVSGDWIFAQKVSELAGQGLPTHVYSHAAALSKRLQFAATTITTTITTETMTIRKAA